MDKMKLQNILLKLANDVLDLEKSGKTLGEPIDEAVSQILDLLDKSLPEDRAIKGYNEMAGYSHFASGYNMALADVRKVIKEEA